MKTLNTEEMIKTLKYLKCGLHEKWFKNEIEWFDNIIELLEQGRELKENLIQFLERKNPYPEDVFLVIKKEDFNKINNLFEKELGYPIDRLSGNMGRRIYKSIIEDLRKAIK